MVRLYAGRLSLVLFAARLARAPRSAGCRGAAGMAGADFDTGSDPVLVADALYGLRRDAERGGRFLERHVPAGQHVQYSSVGGVYQPLPAVCPADFADRFLRHAEPFGSLPRGQMLVRDRIEDLRMERLYALPVRSAVALAG